MYLLKCDADGCETVAPVDGFVMPDGWAIVRTARRLTDTERAAALKKLTASAVDLPMLSSQHYNQAAMIVVEEKLYRICTTCREKLPAMKPHSGEDICPELPMGLPGRPRIY